MQDTTAKERDENQMPLKPFTRNDQREREKKFAKNSPLSQLKVLKQFTHEVNSSWVTE